MAYVPVQAELAGKVAIVTGANAGMGKATACELARMGAETVLACRSAERGEAAARDIVAATGTEAVSAMALDLSSLASVRAFAAQFIDRFGRLDVLVNNGAASLRVREVTPEGFERHWATNVLGPQLLTSLLVPALEASRKGRVVTISTRAAGGLDLADTQYEHRRFNGTAAYRASKQASRMLAWDLATRLKERSITVNAANPGYVVTDLTKSAGGLVKVLVGLTSHWANTPLDGADTAIWLAASRDVEGVTAKFWSKRHEIACKFRDPAGIDKLVALTSASVRV